ncbi:Hypothetical predicted protein [Mytilus galloprovincialis]|uniref:Uncharacterized protein n=2 Tax=Mytilus galloprovincialis TaxID=29158 RepID=A0A8B6F9N1_MYTGA|nr:Hypothetical predicted protein [Mytilus galloprovincialis]
MGDAPPLFVLIPMVLVVKFVFWITICYTCSNRYRNSRTTIIQQTVMKVEDDNGITGIENLGYMRPFITETPDHNATQAVLAQPPYDHNTISPCLRQNYR